MDLKALPPRAMYWEQPWEEMFNLLSSYGWWNKSQTTTWDVWNPVNYGINYHVNKWVTLYPMGLYVKNGEAF